MATQSPSSRASTKTLILAAAVMGTVGGWLAFASATPANNQVTAAPAAQAGGQAIVLPTLVPIDDAVAASQSVAAQPQAQAPRQPSQAMRSVTIPQSPMAMSRTSR